jgi:capsular polysaccharide biosynthesis protein
MTLTDVMRVLVRRGWIVLLAAILTAGAAFVFSRLQTPVFRATQAVLLKPARPDNGLTLTMRNLMQNYVARLSIEDRAREVIDQLQLDMLPGYVKENTRVTPDLNAFVINIDVDLPDGDTANRIARRYGENFQIWRDQENAPLRQEDRINAELLGTPQYGLFRPQTTVNVLAGALLGLILGGVVVFVLEYLDANILRRREDVERFLGLTVLSNLPEVE